MTISIKHAKVDNITAWTQSDLNAQIALGNFPVGTVLNDIVLSTDWNAALNTLMATGKLLGRTTAGTGSFEELAVGSGLSLSAGTLNIGTNSTKRDICVTFDGGGIALAAGKTVYLANVNFAGTITGNSMLADQSGSGVVDVWKVAYGSAPPTVSNTIAASALPTLSSAQKSQDNTLTGWTTSVSAGDTFAFKLNSATTITSLSLTLQVTIT